MPQWWKTIALNQEALDWPFETKVSKLPGKQAHLPVTPGIFFFCLRISNHLALQLFQRPGSGRYLYPLSACHSPDGTSKSCYTYSAPAGCFTPAQTLWKPWLTGAETVVSPKQARAGPLPFQGLILPRKRQMWATILFRISV